MLENAHRQPADDVDEQNQQPRHGIAANEFLRTVHGAVKVGFLLDFRAALAGSGFINHAGVQVGINRHLFAGHGIQGEARAHFRNPPGAFGHHHKVNQHQDAEHHQTNHHVAADEEEAERLNHLARRICPVMPFEQHDAGRSHVQRQPHQGRHQQHHRKDGNIQHPRRRQRHQQHNHRHRDVEGKKHVQQNRRQRQHHHRHHNQDERRRAQHPQFAGRHECLQVQPVGERGHRFGLRIGGAAQNTLCGIFPCCPAIIPQGGKNCRPNKAQNAPLFPRFMRPHDRASPLRGSDAAGTRRAMANGIIAATSFHFQETSRVRAGFAFAAGNFRHVWAAIASAAAGSV